MPVFPESLVFIDLETTGANFINDRIIEIGLVLVDQNGVREWSSLVNPRKEIPPFITGLTGIDSAMVSEAPDFAQLAPEIIEKLRGRLFVAHNARFDYGFIKREFNRLGMDFSTPCLCTVKLSRKLFPEHHRHSLDALITRFGISVENRHRALADAQVLCQLWQLWNVQLPREKILATIDALLGRPDLPPQIDSAIIDALPEALGTYAFLAEDGQPMLVRRTANIRQRVLTHFSPSQRDTALVRNVHRIEWRETAGELGARLCEFEFNNQTRSCPAQLCSWQLVQYAEGDFRPQLVFATEHDFTRTENLFGLYANRKEALHALRKIAEAHRLCYKLIGLGSGQSSEACVAYRQKTCRGACIGKEPLSAHGARLMAAFAKFRLAPWPYAGAVVLIERDEFGMHEDWHLIDHWRYLGTAQNERGLCELFERRAEIPFVPEIYRILTKFVRSGSLCALPFPAGG